MNYEALNKIIKKYKAIELRSFNGKTNLKEVKEEDKKEKIKEEVLKENNLYQDLIFVVGSIHNEKIARELDFLTQYYGLAGESLTLEAIGQKQENKLTRERIRQIIDSILFKAKRASINPYQKSLVIFKELESKSGKNFLRSEQVLEHPYFSSWQKNIKGLIAFFNDCDIRQIAYRKKYYFYLKGSSRKDIINFIQNENKGLRRQKTIEKMNQKSKTVTYVPNDIRDFLNKTAKNEKLNLNSLYENILNQFISDKPYENNDYPFPKTKSWRARKGKAEWKQIGIYINKDIFEKIKNTIKQIKKNRYGNVSMMSFICQAFVWYKTEK